MSRGCDPGFFVLQSGGINMKLLAMETEITGADWSNADALLEEEARHVYDLYLAGVVREIYFTESHEAVINLECADKAEAERLLGEFPLVRAGLIRFALKELHPYDGYSRLME
jgi:hypothetical protein